jgi:alanine racemase
LNRGVIAEIDLSALSRNLRSIRELSVSRQLIAVVKADAYGHGAVEVSRRLVREGVEYLGVAYTEEARELRESGIQAPLLVFFDTYRDSSVIISLNLIPVIGSTKEAERISKDAEKRNIRVPVHVEVDTGMGRLGLRGDVVRQISEIANLKGIRLEGVMSHFSEAESSDTAFTRRQLQEFIAVRDGLHKAGVPVRLFHMAYSAAVACLPEAGFDAVRPGLMLYGYCPSTVSLPLLPVMAVKTRIVALRRLPSGTPVSYGRTFVTSRDSLIASIAAGYADGYSRRFSSNAEVLIRGRRAPVVGRVCMDLTMVDVTDVCGVEESDEVVLMGSQGSETVDAAELALRADTIPYEITTSLGSRARRIYTG